MLNPTIDIFLIRAIKHILGIPNSFLSLSIYPCIWEEKHILDTVKELVTFSSQKF